MRAGIDMEMYLNYNYNYYFYLTREAVEIIFRVVEIILNIYF